MASTLSISTTIDHIIQHANEVKVCQEQMKVIAAALTRLRDALTNDSHLDEDIEQILKAIDKVVASCNENEASLNGVAYRDLQSLLCRLQWYLAQHEANTTDTYTTKIRRLGHAYNEMHTLMDKTYDERMKQRLLEMEQHTKENTTEQLRRLREKHTQTIESHLRSCIELHKSVLLTSLTPESIAKVTHTFYQKSLKTRISLKLPLTRPFTRFEPDECTPFERNELRRLRSASEERDSTKSTWQRLVSTPYMMSIAERNHCVEEKNVTEEHILRTRRCIVILGDPGSGKTSFVRWLVCHLAQTLLLSEQHSTDYGPLRIPILIRVSDFSKMLKDQPTLTLFNYIGKRVLQDYIQQGQALIILDGLDEVPTSDQRSKLITMVESFADTYVQTPAGTTALDNSHLSRLLDDPSKSGGNQLIITSRIVGYHVAPLTGRFAHYTVQPINLEQTKKFVNYWFSQVHQQLLDALSLAVSSQEESHGEALQKELEKTENAGILQLASNPALLSIICTISFNQLENTPLPIRQYGRIINSMLTLWNRKQSTTSKPKLIRILSQIAFHIHKYAPSNLIDQEEMREICLL